MFKIILCLVQHYHCYGAPKENMHDAYIMHEVWYSDAKYSW